MNEFFTRCPHCLTVFRLQAQQLQAAQGRVRCGACFQVFAGAEQRVADPVNPAPKPVAATPSTTATATDTAPLPESTSVNLAGLPSLDDIFNAETRQLLAQLQQDELDDDEDEGESPEAYAAICAQVSELEQARELMQQDDGDDGAGWQADRLVVAARYPVHADKDKETPRAIDQKVSADFAPQQGEPALSAEPSARIEPHFASADLSAKEPPPNTLPANNAEEDAPFIAQADAERPTQVINAGNLTTSDWPETAGITGLESASPESSADESSVNASDANDTNDFGETLSEVGAEPEYRDHLTLSEPLLAGERNNAGSSATPTENTGSDAPFHADNWRLAPLDPNVPEPDVATTRRLPWRGLAYFVGSLALMAVLISQVFWPQRGDLREHAQIGPWLERLCNQIDCQLPARRNVDKIVFLQRSVIKDVQDPKKMHIDLLVQNNAGFDQAYPAIELQFTDTDGQIIARQQFQPGQYLQAIDANSRMPDAVPVHISFSVIEPKPTVSGYEFAFHKAAL